MLKKFRYCENLLCLVKLFYIRKLYMFFDVLVQKNIFMDNGVIDLITGGEPLKITHIVQPDIVKFGVISLMIFIMLVIFKKL